MSVTRYAAFLRGVNVGGVTLKMADVATTMRDAGFSDVVTILASGNVLLSAPGDAAAVRASAEAALRHRFGYDAWVLVYDTATVRTIAESYPFEPEVEGQQSGPQNYVTFVSDPAILDELCDLGAGDEKVARGDGVLYWQVPKGSTLTSTVGATMGKRRYKSSTTTRNLRTLQKVLRG
jgi:uncharacterized protein (DUF1697 family)